MTNGAQRPKSVLLPSSSIKPRMSSPARVNHKQRTETKKHNCFSPPLARSFSGKKIFLNHTNNRSGEKLDIALSVLSSGEKNKEREEILIKKDNFFCSMVCLKGGKHWRLSGVEVPCFGFLAGPSMSGRSTGCSNYWSAASCGSSPSPWVSDVHSVRLSRKSCIIRVLSL